MFTLDSKIAFHVMAHCSGSDLHADLVGDLWSFTQTLDSLKQA